MILEWLVIIALNPYVSYHCYYTKCEGLEVILGAQIGCSKDVAGTRIGMPVWDVVRQADGAARSVER